jgi:hypothetical protein
MEQPESIKKCVCAMLYFQSFGRRRFPLFITNDTHARKTAGVVGHRSRLRCDSSCTEYVTREMRTHKMHSVPSLQQKQAPWTACLHSRVHLVSTCLSLSSARVPGRRAAAERCEATITARHPHLDSCRDVLCDGKTELSTSISTAVRGPFGFPRFNCHN